MLFLSLRYTSVAASLALLLIRLAKPRISWLGTVDIRHDDDSPTATQTDATASRLVFVPLDDRDGMRDPSIRVLPPPPGVLMLRFEEVSACSRRFSCDRQLTFSLYAAGLHVS